MYDRTNSLKPSLNLENPQDREVMASHLLDLLDILEVEHQKPDDTLVYSTTYQLLMVTILLTQSSEDVVNVVARELFSLYPTPELMVAAPRRELERLIQSCGFYRQKAKYMQESSKILLEKYDGIFPQTLIELTQFPGIARKTANQFLAQAFNIAEGIVVDTHVHRVSNRLGISEGKSASKVEHDLVRITESKHRILVSELFMAHGQKVCYIHEPMCGNCAVSHLCRYAAAERDKSVPT